MARTNRNIVTVNREVQDLVKGMVVMAGGRVFKIARVIPLPGFNTAQIVTRQGNLINLPVTAQVKVRAYAKL